MTLVHLIIGLALLPILLWIIRQVMPIIRERVTLASARLGTLAGSAFRWAHTLLLADGKFSSTQAVSQSLGAVVMLGATCVLALSEYAFCTATLLPMIGFKINVQEGILGGLHQWIGVSIILLSVVFGIVITDLIGWTCMTEFGILKRDEQGRIDERGRQLAFWTALLSLLGSVAIAIVLAVHRSFVLALDDTAVEQGLVWSLPAVVLITFAILLLIGIFFAVGSLVTFVNMVMAFVAAIFGILIGAVKLVLILIDMMAELVLACMPAPRRQPGAMQTGLAQVMRGIGRFAAAVSNKVRALVQLTPRHNGSTEPSDEPSRRSTSDVSQNGRGNVDTAGLGVDNYPD